MLARQVHGSQVKTYLHFSFFFFFGLEGVDNISLQHVLSLFSYKSTVALEVSKLNPKHKKQNTNTISDKNKKCQSFDFMCGIVVSSWTLRSPKI